MQCQTSELITGISCRYQLARQVTVSSIMRRRQLTSVTGSDTVSDGYVKAASRWRPVYCPNLS